MGKVNPERLFEIIKTEIEKNYFCDLKDPKGTDGFECKEPPPNQPMAAFHSGFFQPGKWGNLELTTKGGVTVVKSHYVMRHLDSKTGKEIEVPIQAEFTLGGMNNPSATEKPFQVEIKCDSHLEQGARTLYGCTKSEKGADKGKKPLVLTPIHLSKEVAAEAAEGYKAVKGVVGKQQEKLQPCRVAKNGKEL